MAKKKQVVKSSKKVVKEPKVLKDDARLRKKPKYKTFRLHKRIKHHEGKLPSWWSLFKMALRLMAANKRALLWFLVVYGFLNLLLVRGFESPIDIDGLRESFEGLVDEQTSNIATGFTAFGLLVNASTQGADEIAQAYQSFLLIVASLAIIWLYRQQQAGNSVGMRMAFYRGMYPMIPFILVLLTVGLQFLPAIIGNFMFTTVIDGGLAVGFLEETVWLLFLLSTFLLTLYMISSSAIALYIVTLPEMEPMHALRQARELVRHRRAQIILRLVAIILALFFLLFIVVLPVIFIAPTLAEWMFFTITVLGIPLVHAYMFSLYRELL